MTLRKIWSLMRKDEEAGKRLAFDLMIAGKCIIIYSGVEGQEVMVEDTSIPHKAACVHSPDASACW
jgi:hypothetical protein